MDGSGVTCRPVKPPADGSANSEPHAGGSEDSVDTPSDSQLKLVLRNVPQHAGQ